MDKKIIFILMVGILVLTIGFVVAEINTSTIEGAPTNDGGDGGAIAIDSSGFVHAVYNARGLIRPTWPYTAYYANDTIRYCNNIEGSWSCEFVSDSGGRKGRPLIALDSKDNVYFADGGTLCNNIEGNWSCDTPGGIRAIALDSNDKVHLITGGGDILEYCNNIAGEDWDCINLATGDDSLYNAAIKIGRDNKAHLIYTNISDIYPIKYCNNMNGTFFDCEDIKESYGSAVAMPYKPIGMDLDSNNKVHFAFKGANKSLIYCNNTAGNWSCDTVTTDSRVIRGATGTSVVLGFNDKVHIFDATANEGYYDPNRLRYCSNLNGDWKCEEHSDKYNRFAPWRTPSAGIKQGLLANSSSFSNSVHVVVLSGKYLFSYANISICNPSTCLSLGDGCGILDDGCGGEIDCGNCPLTYPCVSNSTYSCDGNDVYWYDSCGNKEDRKEECGTMGCLEGVCIEEEEKDTNTGTSSRGGHSGGGGGGATSYRVYEGDDSGYIPSNTGGGMASMIGSEESNIGLIENDIYNDLLIGFSIGIVILIVMILSLLKKNKRIK